ncbi:hypothetical protein [Caldanaerobius polysaccharolyticus]|uniref:hypothetical protein n=1 Tax=Caldanaerobius polysaccharolyticus TaxID=44256 RepID=UPI00047A3642|nr:hypothetical protein [Caldanaerobius polysaccharolyticus]
MYRKRVKEIYADDEDLDGLYKGDRQIEQDTVYDECDVQSDQNDSDDKKIVAVRKMWQLNRIERKQKRA